MTFRTLLGAAVAALGARPLLRRVLLAKLRRDVGRLNVGDRAPLVRAYADDALLRFNEGPHRWSGTHRGRPAIDRFLHEYTRAGLQGDIRELWIAGPPWALTLIARFDDRVPGPGGQNLYANRVVIVARTRWGRIVEQEDFYEDTRRIDAFEARLRAQGVDPLGTGVTATHRA